MFLIDTYVLVFMINASPFKNRDSWFIKWWLMSPEMALLLSTMTSSSFSRHQYTCSRKYIIYWGVMILWNIQLKSNLMAPSVCIWRWVDCRCIHRNHLKKRLNNILYFNFRFQWETRSILDDVCENHLWLFKFFTKSDILCKSVVLLRVVFLNNKLWVIVHVLVVTSLCYCSCCGWSLCCVSKLNQLLI